MSETTNNAADFVTDFAEIEPFRPPVETAALDNYIRLKEELDAAQKQVYLLTKQLEAAGVALYSECVPEDFCYARDGAAFIFRMDVEDGAGVIHFEKIDLIQ